MKKQIVFEEWEFERLIIEILIESIGIFIEETKVVLSEEKQEELYDKLERKIKFKINNLDSAGTKIFDI